MRRHHGRQPDLNAIASQISALLFPYDNIDPDEPLATALDRWLAEHVEHNCKKTTRYGYRKAVEALNRAAGPIKLAEVTPRIIAEALAVQPRGTHYNCFSAWSSALNWLGLHGMMPRRRPKQRVRRAFLDAAGMEHWFAAMKMGRQHRWARAVTIDVLLLLTLVPFRRAEAVALKWADVDLDPHNPTAYLPDSKTGPRSVPLGKLGAAVIAAQPRKGDYIFPPARACPTPHVTASSISHGFVRVTRRYSEATGYQWPREMCVHALRHSWASNALLSGESHEVVRRAMGHSSLYMLERYSHVHATEIVASADRLQASIVPLTAQREPADPPPLRTQPRSRSLAIVDQPVTPAVSPAIATVPRSPNMGDVLSDALDVFAQTVRALRSRSADELGGMQAQASLRERLRACKEMLASLDEGEVTP